MPNSSVGRKRHIERVLEGQSLELEGLRAIGARLGS